MNSSRYATNNNNYDRPSSPTSPTNNSQDPTSPSSLVFQTSTALADLGSARFNADTAQITDRDASLYSNIPVNLRQGRAPKGYENAAFAWSTFQYTTAERDEREEKKGDLHDGLLHRLNRAARGEDAGGVSDRDGFGGGRGARGSRGRGRGFMRGGGYGNEREMQRDDGRGDALCAGRKMGEALPMAKGMAEEMEKGMFWDGPIV